MKEFRNSLIAINIWPVVVCLIFTQATTAQIIYVNSDANGLNNGTSWTNAYNYLQDALDDADPCDDIWVAQGVYRPTKLTDPCDVRTATFQLINGVVLYGGFPDTGDPNFDDREPNLYETVLSGDLDGNDVDVNDPCDLLTEPTRAENSYHVVTGSGTDANAVLDGFTITAGNANGLSFNYYAGGGTYNFRGSPTLTGCIFKDDSAYDGGAIWNYDAEPTITNCTFESNSSVTLGGAILNDRTTAQIIDCDFNGNSAEYGGGVGENDKSESTFINCTFNNNSADEGGGICILSDSSTIVTNCAFRGNSATKQYCGGGAMSLSGSSLFCIGCTYSYNLAKGDRRNGGAIYNLGNNLILEKCVFYNNSTVGESCRGGAIFSQQSNSEIIDCDFNFNKTDDYGGAIFNGLGISTLIRCSFRENSAGSGGGMADQTNNTKLFDSCFSGNLGGGLSSSNSNTLITGCVFNYNLAGLGGGIDFLKGSITLTHSILWGNTATRGAQIYAKDPNKTAIISIDYCNIQGGKKEVFTENVVVNWGEGNIDEQPLLTPDGHLRNN